MAGQVVVYSNQADAESAQVVMERLRVHGVKIVEEQPHMLLVSGSKEAVDRALRAARGWSVTDLTTVPPPDTRQRVRKPPS